MVKVLRKNNPVSNVQLADLQSHIISNSPSPVRKKQINIFVDGNGNVSVDNICLGDQWDHLVTVLHFDLSTLNWERSNFSQYLFRLSFYKEEINQIGSIHFTEEPLTYEFNGVDFEVPDEITQEASTYRIALIIQEKMSNEDKGNNENHMERFISKEWKGYVRPNFYSTDLPLDIVPTINRGVSLSKTPVAAFCADDGLFALDNSNLGNIHDAYIRVIQGKKITANIRDGEVFILFKKDRKIAAAKFNKDSQGKLVDTFIPSAVVAEPGVWKAMIAAYKGDIHDPEYAYCSTGFDVTIEPNFLTSGAFATGYDTQFSLSSDNKYANFVDSRGCVFETADGNLFFYDEY